MQTQSPSSEFEASYKGYILFLPYAAGSKSESLRPILAMGAGTNASLHRKGDNPFENKSIQPYHGKYCEVTGTLDRERRLIEVESIEELDEPYKPPPPEPEPDTTDEEQTNANAGGEDDSDAEEAEETESEAPEENESEKPPKPEGRED